MNTKIEPDVEILDALDFEPPCEIRASGHEGHPATWALALGCGHPVLVCDEGKNYTVNKVPNLWTCEVCGLIGPLATATPLGRRS